MHRTELFDRSTKHYQQLSLKPKNPQEKAGAETFANAQSFYKTPLEDNGVSKWMN